MISGKQQVPCDPVSKPVQKPSIPPLVNTGPTRGAELKRAVLLPPSSFTLPSRAKGAPLQTPIPEGVEVVHASTSTHPASTPRTSLDSEKRVAFSPSSATSTSSRGSEDEKEGDEKSTGECSEEEEREEGEWDGEKEVERCKPDMKEDAVNSVLFGQLKDEGNLQERVAAMKNILQEFQDMKVTYR